MSFVLNLFIQTQKRNTVHWTQGAEGVRRDTDRSSKASSQANVAVLQCSCVKPFYRASDSLLIVGWLPNHYQDNLALDT